ncbi:MAG: GNAT family N-acetyltransferase [Oscillospiraceae bacterium]|nr:GNAT family N-acetyltransferase [Oscillospiraceae bacterium]MBQ8978281.1 GNAT family N-acetyltransferase [Oscillospiraceae bacterium]
MEIRRLDSRSDNNDIRTALRLALRVFLEFDAPLFPREGLESFRAYIYSGTIEDAVSDGTACIFAAYDTQITGMMGVTSEGHIFLAFVDGAYQNKGVGTALLKAAEQMLPGIRLTVNAAPPGYPFYRRHGFVPTSEEITKDGLTFTPMEKLP